MEGKRILVTGATGLFGLPLTLELAKNNDVVAAARFTDPAAKGQLEAAGVRTVTFDLTADSVETLPGDVEYVFNAGAALGPRTEVDQHYAFRGNTHAVGALMSYYRHVKAFVHCTTASAYRYAGQRPFTEEDDLGLHRHNYSLSKIAGEGVAHVLAREYALPTVLLRIASLYGPAGGAITKRIDLVAAGEEVPLYPEKPNNYNPMYESDYVELAIRAFDAGGVPPTVVNFCGSETMSAEDYCSYAATLMGTTAKFRYGDDAYWPLWMDPARMHEVLGRTQVGVREGIRRVVEARYPDRLKA